MIDRQNGSGENTRREQTMEQFSEEEKKMLVRKEIVIELLRCGDFIDTGVDEIISDGKKLVDFIYDRQTVEIEPTAEDEEDEE
jgi:hypothetical protein